MKKRGNGGLIVKIDRAMLEAKRPRTIGCNSQRGSHGDSMSEPIIRMRTSEGVTGWARSNASEPEARLLLGKSLDEVFSVETGTAIGYDLLDLPLWDLAGNILGKPVYALLGGKGEERVAIYDGSIYMEDVDPETREDRGVGLVADAVKAGLQFGYTDFKVKIGRGARWMEKTKGFARDVEVLHLVRELIGPKGKLLMDGNNAYSPEEARALVDEVRECNIHWFEEPFEEDIEKSLAFKRFLHEKAPEILLADGEGTRPFQPEIRRVLRASAIDVVQFDLRPCPITSWLTILPLLDEVGIVAAPHNWASHFLNYYIPQIGRGIRNFAMAETDTSVIKEVDTSLYRIVDGKLEIPDAPGFGLRLDNEAVDRLVVSTGWSISA